MRWCLWATVNGEDEGMLWRIGGWMARVGGRVMNGHYNLEKNLYIFFIFGVGV